MVPSFMYRGVHNDHHKQSLYGTSKDAEYIPFALEGRVGIGESIIELGGLSVLAVDLDLGTGSHTMKFDEPTPAPIDSFDLTASIGELRVSG